MLYSTIMLVFKKNKKLLKFDKELTKYKIKTKKIDNEPFIITHLYLKI